MSFSTIPYSPVNQVSVQAWFYFGAGTRAHQIHLLPPSQIQKLADRSEVISKVSKCSKIQIRL